MGKLIDLTGKRFGRLVVISFSHLALDKRSYWLCKCDCGSEPKIIAGSNLASGGTISCGCFHKEELSNRCKKEYGTYAINQLINSYAHGAKKKKFVL